MTRMFNRPHLGLTLRDDVLPACGWASEAPMTFGWLPSGSRSHP